MSRLPHIRRIYLAGRIAYHKGLPNEPPANLDEDHRSEFRRGWDDARRKDLHNGGKARVLHR